MFPKEKFPLSTKRSLPHGRGDVSEIRALEKRSPKCLPHGRGDVSLFAFAVSDEPESSPRAWGCFLLERDARGGTRVFPTGVGMFPQFVIVARILDSLPHGRGDVSTVDDYIAKLEQFSPRAWGCF